MAKNLKKFVNPKFTRTIDLALMRRLLERHAESLDGFDMAVFDGEATEAREAVQNFFAGPEENYPEGLVADLHRIAELGSSHGLRLLQERAVRFGVVIAPERDEDGNEQRQDPKHVALAVFLDHPRLFEAAADFLLLTARPSLAEFAGKEEGVAAQINDHTRNAFEQAAAIMFEAELLGRYCRVGWYDDDGEINLVITHGSTITTKEVVEDEGEQIISYRAVEHAVLSYASADGRLKIGGVPKASQAELAEIFADTMLERPDFFASADAQRLYTLKPIEREGFGFALNHDFDPQIRRVRIVEAQANRVATDPQTGDERVLWSIVTRDNRDNALARLGESRRDMRFGPDSWRLSHIVVRIYFDVGKPKPAQVTVKLKPPSQAIFKRERFEGQIMDLLRRNGFCYEREPERASAAAE